MNDIHCAIGQIRKSPDFPPFSTLTLAVAIGTNISIFILIDDRHLYRNKNPIEKQMDDRAAIYQFDSATAI